LRGIAVKDFIWAKDAKGKWIEQWMPLGQGMVHWPEFFRMVAQADFDGPLQIHFEYPLGAATGGGRYAPPDSRDVIYAAMKRDLSVLRAQLAEAGL
jgi:sugar phosphate isomerase/epimerase